MRDARKFWIRRNLDFEYDGEMGANTALNENLMNLYIFANCLAVIF